MGALRDAASSAITNLGHGATRAEDFGASPESPQQACLAGVRDADILILILGPRYGQTQESGLSATHEEYREARGSRPVLVFIQNGGDFEPAQTGFIREVQSWEHGHFVAYFDDAGDLRDKVFRGLHELVLAQETAPLDEAELANRAQAMIATSTESSAAALLVAVAAGPLRSVLRPAELESPDLRHYLMAEALTGSDAILTPSAGTQDLVRGDRLQLTQDRGTGLVSLDERGDLLVVQPAAEATDWRQGMTSIIEEEIARRIARGIRFCARVLDHIDPIKRITHVAPVAAIRGASYMPWRTRGEHDRNPNSATVGFGRPDSVVVVLSPAVRRRSVLLQETQQLAEDFTVRLRRELAR